MTDKNFEPIPIPPRQRWREFRIAYLPVVTFIMLVVAIGWMWCNYVEPGAIIGEVEMIHANIIGPAGGTVQDLKVDYLQPVTNGQELAVVISMDAAQVKAELAAAEADLRLMKARMDIDKTRNLNSYGQLRVGVMVEKFNLEIARIRARQAQQEFERAQKMLDDQIIPRGINGGLQSPRNDFGFDVAARDYDILKSDVATREQTVADLEKNLAEMDKAGIVRIDPEDAAIERAIQAQCERVNQLQKPVVLKSPIDGFISDIKHRTGERINAGVPVVVVSGRSSDRIAAWVHTPVIQRPHIGDTVEVRQMGMGRASFEGKIIQVGSQLETVSPMLQTPTANPERIEVGLPLLVKAERARELIPGEAVLLRIIKQAPQSAAN